ncbi:glycine--tRNA ligase subunit beta [Lactobacillus iners]|jgi:glycyl-tRNA synthetase beta subunit|uniref:glycine--tRNA ligase subunit beta n=1 Tax=Lactobacillus iners TaxID=147802 RepID=UPI0001E5DCD0|nr:glycine--tRNA ligase subunit beta [Lactobacillus iners]EFO67646.1 glycine--tRNA ligase, beta subunit [Lactobacillus iners LactinV 09V1-c]MCT7674657.1 glycine--tRNA ligase subunit beta [Lactobacillus iners]MCT7723732.1 glycine--tRNA ligase subunit beta [Lactobacillus iners]MCT7726701.1 glycine--tRNA ligase subunit beta [Lactobacillus iners]MCT7813677.1 glycine--tRNA ligase subunit beta [Lactobacillus iners]
MTKDYLFEIGTEEMPAHVVAKSVKQLADRTGKFLKDNGLSFKNIKTFSTPRRLTILVQELAEKQADIDEIKKGPSKKIALDKDGNWSKAAEGFVRGQNMSVDDIYFQKIKDVEYAYIHVKKEGKKATEILLGMDQIVKELAFPTKMRWGNYDLEFVRPIHWIVSLFGSEIIPVKILDIVAGRKTYGHRFLGESLVLATSDDYESALKSQFVIADANQRKNMILSQINSLCEKNDWQVKIDSGLLEEVTNLVEYPTIFSGSFNEKYLNIPKEVLITSMKDNQRYFEVYDHEGTLINHFIAIRNGNSDYLDNVIAGNEKVLVARLDDAQFFYDEDKKYPLSHFVEKLSSVSFHDKIGSMAEKMLRVKLIGEYIGEKINISSSELADFDRAADIYKFDLVTNMVGEFAELQGIMGTHYAELAGERKAVSQAIKESYLPSSADGDLPTTKIGSLLSIADKLDTIIAFFGAGMIPNSSNDPYALRRSAYGIVRILINQSWNISIEDALKDIIALLKGKTVAKLPNDEATQAEISDFIINRVKQLLQVKKYSYDVIDTVLASNQQNVANILSIADILQENHDDSKFKKVVESLTRIANILKKADFSEAEQINPDLFENNSEKALYDKINLLLDKSLDVKTLYSEFVQLQPVIDEYFDSNMILDKNEAVKINRLSQLKLIDKLALEFGDLSKLVIK